jgi:hypothetical protein
LKKKSCSPNRPNPKRNLRSSPQTRIITRFVFATAEILQALTRKKPLVKARNLHRASQKREPF